MIAIAASPLLALSAADELQQIQAKAAGEVGLVLLSIGLVLGGVYGYRHILPKVLNWRRRNKRTREHMDQRELKLKEMVADMLVDGVLDRQVEGQISTQEANKLFAWLSDQLDIPGLVPSKARAEIVKRGIKARRAKKINETPVNIPGPKPGEAVPYTPPKKRLWSIRSKSV